MTVYIILYFATQHSKPLNLFPHRVSALSLFISTHNKALYHFPFLHIIKHSIPPHSPHGKAFHLFLSLHTVKHSILLIFTHNKAHYLSLFPTHSNTLNRLLFPHKIKHPVPSYSPT